MFELVAENLHFSEGPRWHQNKLWFSDFYQHAVFSIDEQGILEKVVDIPNQPSGLGWMPDGSMLIVSMLDRKVMKFKDIKTYIQYLPGCIVIFYVVLLIISQINS